MAEKPHTEEAGYVIARPVMGATSRYVKVSYLGNVGSAVKRKSKYKLHGEGLYEEAKYSVRP